jgi:hypothetical protein
MTHDETYSTDKFDELLAKIDYNQVEGTWDIDMKSQCFDLVAQNYRALRAVVELHKPVLDTFPYGLELDAPEVTERYECDDCFMSYPCPTIQAIEKELG